MLSIQSHLTDTLHQRLQETAASQPEQIACTFLEAGRVKRELTYAKLDRRARSIADRLLQHANVGDRALLSFHASLDFVEAFLGCLYAGVVAVPAYAPRKNRNDIRLQSIVRDSTPQVVLCNAQTSSTNSFQTRSGSLTQLVVDQIEDCSFAELPEIQPVDLAFLQYTSGSTSQPKGVMVSHRNIMANQELMAAHWGFNKDSVMVSWLPMFHDMGLIAGILAPLFGGFRTVLMAPNDFLRKPIRWLHALSEYEASVTGAPNFAWDLCAKRIHADEKKGLDLSSLRIASNGGEPVRESTYRKFVEQFRECGFQESAFAPSYGMAESTLLISGVPFGRKPAVVCASRTELEAGRIREDLAGVPFVSCGTIGPGTIAKIVNPETRQDCLEDEVGEVWLHGNSNAEGYFGKPDESQRTFNAQLIGDDRPWLRTGDLGFFRNGELYLTGRLKDVLIINGRNIYPQDIELLVEQQFDFIGPNSVAAFTKDEATAEIIIVLEGTREIAGWARNPNKSKENLSQLQDRLEMVAAKMQEDYDVLVSEFEIVRPASFPRTSSGKVQRSLAKKMHLQGTHQTLVTWAELRQRQQQLTSLEPECSVSELDTHPITSVTHDEKQLGSIRGWLREFGTTHNGYQADESRHFSTNTLLNLGEQGLMGMFIPKAYGGLELSTFAAMKVFEQTAAIDLSLSVFLGIHNGLGVTPIVRHGSENLKEQYLPSIAQGRCLVSFAVSEASSASNPLGVKTTAKHAEHGWVLDGAKKWVGIADWAKLIVVFAKRLDQQGHHNGTAAIVVPRSTSGLEIGPETVKLGMRGFVQNSVQLNSASVSHGNLLGEAGDGFSIVSQAMTLGRLGVAAQSVGVIKRCAQMMHRFASRRMIATGLLIDHPSTIINLDEMLAAIDGLEAAYVNLARMLDAGLNVPGELSAALKVCGSNAAWQATDSLVQSLGARGYMEPNGAARMLRDARVLRIGEGTSEALLSYIGSSALNSDSIHGFIRADLSVPILAEQLQGIADEARESIKTQTDQLLVQCLLGEVASWTIVKALSSSISDSAMQWVDHERNQATARLHAVTRRQSSGQMTTSRRAEIVSRLALIDAELGATSTNASYRDTDPDSLVEPAPASSSDFKPVKKPSTGESATVTSVQKLKSQVEDHLTQIVLRQLEANLGQRRDIANFQNRSFAELGIDSLEGQGLLSELESTFDVSLGDDALFEYATPRQLSAHISMLQNPNNTWKSSDYWVRIVDSRHQLFHQARHAVRDAMSKVYQGWDDDFDRRYDKAAVFFVAGNSHGEITATSRVYLPSRIDQNACPLALADQNPFSGFESDLDMEGGGLMMKDSFSAKLVMRSASRWISAKGLGHVFMAYDVRNRFIENLYLSDLALERVHHPLIAFNSFRHRDTKEPVQWQLVVRRKQTEAESTWASSADDVEMQDFTSL